MIPPKEVSFADEPLAGSNTNMDDESQLLTRLEKSWKSLCVRGLKSRHEMGTLLNGYLGSPTERQPHGPGVLKKAAERLVISESELSRMRWLAHLFEDFSSLKRKVPDCRSWTDFKRMLPGLKPTNGSSVTVPGVSRSQPALRGVERSIDSIAARLDRLDACQEVENCIVLLKELKQAVKACGNRQTDSANVELDETEETSLELCAATA